MLQLTLTNILIPLLCDDLEMNWTNDTIFLENNTCPQLIRGLAETALRQPADPIAFLAHWIYKNCESQERGEKEEVRDEHLQLARAMAEVAGGGTEVYLFAIILYGLYVLLQKKFLF